MILPEGTRVNSRYIIKSCIGQGGFGITYLATDDRLMQDVVLKEFFPDFMVKRVENNEVLTVTNADIETYEKGKARFVNEARLLAALRDMSEIVTIFDFFTENNTAYIVMEYIDGQSLKAMIKQRTEPYTFDEVLKIMNPCLDALHKVHNHGLIHRDFTPDNILITKTGEVRIIDFGASKDYIAQEKTMTVMVKHGYAPLEQYAQDGHQGIWSDVYAACAIIYEMLTLRKPQSAIDRTQVDEVSVYSIENNSVSLQKKNVILKGLSLRAADRYQTLEELIRDLNAPDAPGYNAQDAAFYGTPDSSVQNVQYEQYYYPANNQGNHPVQQEYSQNAAGSKGSSTGLIVGCIVAGFAICAIIISVIVSLLGATGSDKKDVGSKVAKESQDDSKEDKDELDVENQLDEDKPDEVYVEPDTTDVETHDTSTGNWDITKERTVSVDEMSASVPVPSGYYYIAKDMQMDDPYVDYFFNGSEVKYKEYCKEMEQYKVYLVLFPEDSSSEETFYLCGDKNYDGKLNYNSLKNYSDSELQEVFDGFKQEIESDGKTVIDAVFKGRDVSDNFLIGYKARDVDTNEASIKVANADGTHNIWMECYLVNSDNTDHMVDIIVDMIQRTTYN